VDEIVMKLFIIKEYKELNNPNRKRNLNFKKSTLLETNFVLFKHASRPNPTNHLHPQGKLIGKEPAQVSPWIPTLIYYMTMDVQNCSKKMKVCPTESLPTK
jgi:hypothetical protein